MYWSVSSSTVAGEQHVVDADDAFLVELDVVEERRAATQREVQRVVEVVIEIRTRRMTKSTRPRSINSMTQPQVRPASAPPAVGPIVVSLSGASIFSAKSGTLRTTVPR